MINYKKKYLKYKSKYFYFKNNLNNNNILIKKSKLKLIKGGRPATSRKTWSRRRIDSGSRRINSGSRRRRKDLKN